MKAKSKFQIGTLIVILAVFLLIPKLVPAQENQLENYLKEFKENLFKQMNLAPEKERAFRAVEDKHAAARQKIIANLKDAQKQLEDMVAAGKPENKTKMMSLVHAVTEAQDKLFASYRTQRNEELALLTPEQKAKYLVTMINWRHELMQKAMQGEGGQGMGQTPPSMGKTPPPMPSSPKQMQEPPTPKPPAATPPQK